MAVGVVGIILAIVIAVTLIVALVVWYICKRRKKEKLNLISQMSMQFEDSDFDS